MTTNQTIDGVPREQIERALDAIEQVGLQDKFIDYTFVRTVKNELRALLDAPQPSEGELIANGLGYPFSKEEALQLWYSGFKTEPITILEAWDAIGHDIGCNPSKDELLDSLRNMAAICDAHGNDMPAAQPAPVAVVLPERLDLPHRDEFESADQYATAIGEAKNWNACLDEMKRLNPSL